MSCDDAQRSKTIRRLVGVYNADGTMLGELRYFIGARFGRAHCALCDITHGLIRERPAWRACRDTLPVPFDTYHRNDQPARLRDCYTVPPVVAAETDGGGYVVLLGPNDIAACNDSVDCLVTIVRRAVVQAGLVWPM